MSNGRDFSGHVVRFALSDELRLGSCSGRNEGGLGGHIGVVRGGGSSHGGPTVAQPQTFESRVASPRRSPRTSAPASADFPTRGSPPAWCTWRRRESNPRRAVQNSQQNRALTSQPPGMIRSRYPAASPVVPSCSSTFRRFLRHTCNMAPPLISCSRTNCPRTNRVTWWLRSASAASR